MGTEEGFTDRELRAAVYAAFDAKGTDAFPAACRRVVDGWTFAPLIGLDRAIKAARRAALLAEAAEVARMWDEA